jgi:hypothetical protein
MGKATAKVAFCSSFSVSIVANGWELIGNFSVEKCSVGFELGSGAMRMIKAGNGDPSDGGFQCPNEFDIGQTGEQATEIK